MLLAVLDGKAEEVGTELPMPVFDEVAPAAPLADPAKARIALVTEGGLVPKGNPDGLESSRASKYLRLSLEGLRTLEMCIRDRCHLVLSGRDAPDWLVEAADLVTEMGEIKHPWRAGIKAAPGIEF